MVNESPASRPHVRAANRGDARRRCWSGSSDRIGARDRRRRAGSAANSPSAARSLIGWFRTTGVRPQTKAPICARTRGSGPVCARPNCSTARYRFLCEGRICDRSRDGLRLALARDVTLPPKLAVHIDETSEVREARVIWRRGSTIGVRLQRRAPSRRDDGKPKVRAERTLLRDSRLSLFTHKLFSSTRAELASVLMARLIAARVSFSQ